MQNPNKRKTDSLTGLNGNTYSTDVVWMKDKYTIL